MNMTPEIREKYERAAVQLEKHESLTALDGIDIADPWVAIAWKAWVHCNESANFGTCSDVDDLAARLLRDCIKKGESLP
jgi:hypothetical protein